MTTFIARRLLQAIVVLAVVALISFTMFRYVGDPIENILGQEATQADYNELVDRLGLNDPVPVQYFRFLGKALSGDFGVSYRQRRPVTQIIAERAPATLELAFISGLLALTGGIVFGIYTAINRDSYLSHAIMTGSLIGVSLPTFLIGILLIWIFAVELKWLPSFGRGTVTDLGWWTTGLLTISGLKSLILPAITLGLYQLTLIMRLVRAEMLEVLQMDYIRTARANGLPERKILYSHALRNTLIPVISITGLQFGSIIAFAIITESVFHWPGLGLLFIDAIQFVDVPVMAAYLMLIAVIFVIINLIVDILTYAVDPRARGTQPGSTP